MRTLNLGIVAHVDAGKTSLTERLLFAVGVIDEIGSVDAGSTQTDSLALERQRGITIKSAVVSFVIDDVTVNLIDTPGHPDFIAEVERVLSVLDGAVLVVSAVEGVQAQTRVLMRTLQRLKIPTLIFVNKIDRGGAHADRVVEAIAEKLTPAIVPMGSPRSLGTRDAAVSPFGAADARFTASLVEVLADRDEALLGAYLRDGTVCFDGLRDQLAAQTKQAVVHPVFFGSAITGAGVHSLISGITDLLPAAQPDPDGPVSGSVFKVERGPAGEKIAYVAMSSGTVRTRDRLTFRRGSTGKVTAISVFDNGTAVRSAVVNAGQIAKLWGLSEVQIGDRIDDRSDSTGKSPRHQLDEPGDSTGSSPIVAQHFAPPTLETVVVARRRAEKGALHAALTQLAEQDPLINLRQDDRRQEMFVSLYGEVQKEVIQDTLADEFGIEVTFSETTTICVERPTGVGAALETIGKDANPFVATIGLRVEPAPINSGIVFRLEVELGSIPLYVYKTVEDFGSSVEDYVTDTLHQGIYGWQVTDCTVTMTHAGYSAPISGAADFRKLTPLVLMSALRQAGTAVCEPIHHFRLEGPADSFGSTLRALAQLRAVPQSPTMRGSSYVLEGEIPAARVHELQQQLPGLARGEGVLESAFDSYRPVRGKTPTRPRTDHNPLNRKEYLLHVVRRL
jgi:ribosomal protection tetracycline resistance protein